MNDLSIALITGAFGIIGAIVGGTMSILAQIFYDHRKTRKNKRYYLIMMHEKVMYSILVMNNAIVSLLNIIDIDIENMDNFEFEELYKNINSSIEKCSLLWKDFWIVLIKYMPKITNHKEFILLEDIMELINYQYKGTKLDKVISPTKEMLIARRELLLKNKKDLLEVKLFLKEMKKQYYKIIYLKKQKTST